MIKMIALTGSEAAGAIVAVQAGKSLRKSTMEFGGSDAVVPACDIVEVPSTFLRSMVPLHGYITGQPVALLSSEPRLVQGDFVLITAAS
jgi:hypothetical protein